jgi:hypothetical protein
MKAAHSAFSKNLARVPNSMKPVTAAEEVQHAIRRFLGPNSGPGRGLEGAGHRLDHGF